METRRCTTFTRPVLNRVFASTKFSHTIISISLQLDDKFDESVPHYLLGTLESMKLLGSSLHVRKSRRLVECVCFLLMKKKIAHCHTLLNTYLSQFKDAREMTVSGIRIVFCDEWDVMFSQLLLACVCRDAQDLYVRLKESYRQPLGQFEYSSRVNFYLFSLSFLVA